MKQLDFKAVCGQTYGDFNQRIGTDVFLVSTKWSVLYCEGTKDQLSSLKEVLSRGGVESFAIRLLYNDYKAFNTDAMTACSVKDAIAELVPYNKEQELIYAATPDYF